MTWRSGTWDGRTPLSGPSITLVHPRYQWPLYRIPKQHSLGSCENFIMKAHVHTTPVMEISESKCFTKLKAKERVPQN